MTDLERMARQSVTPRQRAELELALQRDKGLQAAVLEFCSRTSNPLSTVFFINYFLWTEDPRLKGESRLQPFTLFPRQIELVEWIHSLINNGQDGAVPKSRDTGATETIMATILHLWRFEGMFSAHVGSRNENYIDKADDPSALLARLDRFYRNLPQFLKVPTYQPKRGSEHRAEMKMYNPEKQSIVTGEAPTPNFGRGARKTLIFLDEAAFWPDLEASYYACGETTDTRLLCSSPNGMNFFGQLTNPPANPVTGLTPKLIETFTMHYTQDPRHDDPEWLAAKKAKYASDPDKFEQEFEMSFTSSVTGKVYPQIAMANTSGRVPYVAGLPTYTFWDFGVTDATAIGWVQYDPRAMRYRVIDYYENKGKAIGFYTPFITGRMPGSTTEVYTEADLEVIRRHAGWIYEAHFGDPAGVNVEGSTNTSIVQTLGKAGIYMSVNFKRRAFEFRKADTQELLPLCDFDSVRCARLIQCFQNSKYPEATASRQTPIRLPIHDGWSHGRTAFEYFAVNNPHRWESQQESDEEPGADPLEGMVVTGDESRLRELMRHKRDKPRAFASRPRSRFAA